MDWMEKRPMVLSDPDRRPAHEQPSARPSPAEDNEGPVSQGTDLTDSPPNNSLKVSSDESVEG
jgi:hypothetical protein